MKYTGLLTFLTFWAALLSGAAKDLGAIWYIGDSITQGNADRSAETTPRSELYRLCLLYTSPSPRDA